MHSVLPESSTRGTTTEPTALRQRAQDVAGLARYLAFESSTAGPPGRLAAELREWAEDDPRVLQLAIEFAARLGDGDDGAVALLRRAAATSLAA